MQMTSIDDFICEEREVQAVTTRPINRGRFVRYSQELDGYLSSFQNFLENKDGLVKVGDYIVEGYEVRKPVLGWVGKFLGIERVVSLDDSNLTMGVVVDALREKIHDGISAVLETRNNAYALLERREAYVGYLLETVEKSCESMHAYREQAEFAKSSSSQAVKYLEKVNSDLDLGENILENKRRKIGLERKQLKLAGQIDLLSKKDRVEEQFIDQSYALITRVTTENSKLNEIAYSAEAIVDYARRTMKQVDNDYESLQALGTIFQDLRGMARTSAGLHQSASAFQKTVGKHILSYRGDMFNQ